MNNDIEIENMLDLNICMDTIAGEFRLIKGGLHGTISKYDQIETRYPIVATGNSFSMKIYFFCEGRGFGRLRPNPRP